MLHTLLNYLGYVIYSLFHITIQIVCYCKKQVINPEINLKSQNAS